MFDQLLNRLGISQTVEEGDDDRTAEFAAAALLLEMTEADMEVELVERKAVRRALARTFGLSASEIEALMDRAGSELDRSASYFPHVETINALCDQDQKAAIVKQMWRVAFADGELDKYEEHYLRKLCQLIHVPHRVFIQTRHEVEESS